MGLATNSLDYYRGLLFNRSVVADSATPWPAACQASLSFTVSWSWLKFMSVELVMPSSHLIPQGCKVGFKLIFPWTLKFYDMPSPRGTEPGL